VEFTWEVMENLKSGTRYWKIASVNMSSTMILVQVVFAQRLLYMYACQMLDATEHLSAADGDAQHHILWRYISNAGSQLQTSSTSEGRVVETQLFRFLQRHYLPGKLTVSSHRQLIVCKIQAESFRLQNRVDNLQCTGGIFGFTSALSLL